MLQARGGDLGLASFSSLAQSVSFTSQGSSFRLNDKHPELEPIGKGRSAYAFKIKETNLVIKVFFPSFESVAKEEADVYKVLGQNPYYPSLYDSGDRYLVIDYISGDTLFDCLVKGIEIRNEYIHEIQQALLYARKQGLNPADIHLKNIILTKDKSIKMIDVARFRQHQKCRRWLDLKKAYTKIYKKWFFPNKTPEFVLNLIAFFISGD